MSRMACVVSWDEDEGVEGSMTRVPVTCDQVISVLSDIVAKNALGEMLEDEEQDIARELARKYVKDML